MADVMLTLHCATSDTEIVVEALRPIVTVPIHLREETVFGRDFADADTAERVSGTLRRSAITLIVPADQIDGLTAAVAASRRRLPIRWYTMPVLASGRIA